MVETRSLAACAAVVCALAAAHADTVTFTWNGGDGNWSDPAMWTASDGSTDSFPHDDTSDGALFPAGQMARVTLDADGYSVSNLLFLAANSDITFTSPAGATNTLTYRAVKTYDYATSTYSNY